MKTLRLLILGSLAITTICQAQQPLIPATGNVDPAEREDAIEAKQAELAVQPQGQFSPLTAQNIVPSMPIAEKNTGYLQALADSLQDDPVQIFNYVHDHIRHVLYFGSKKGAQLTYFEKSGNDFDQCALLVALLHAAGYTNTSYQFGWMELPYDSPDHKDLHHWLQLSLTNSNWTYTSNYLDTLIRVYRGYPADAAIWGANTFGFQRIWVTLTNGGNTYYLDPSFKVSEPIPGINLAAAMGFTSNALMSITGGTNTTNYVSGMSEAAIRGTLTGYTTNLLNYIQSNYPNATVSQILSGWQIVPSTNATLPTSLPFTTYTWGGQMPLQTWTYEPTNMMSTLKISFSGTNFFCYMPQLGGQRLTLTFDPYGFTQLWLEDTDVADNYASDNNVVISVDHPVGYWDTNNNVFVDTTAYDQTTTNSYDIFGNYIQPAYYNYYNIMYGFEPDWSRLKAREDWLSYLRDLGLGDHSFDETCETLHIMGLNHMLQLSYVEQILASQAGVLPQTYHTVGRLAQEIGNGYYFDVFMVHFGIVSASGADTANADLQARASSLSLYFESALEHGVIEQLQNSGLTAASTIKMLELANTNGEAIYLANSNNWIAGAHVRTNLTGYASGTLSTFDSQISAGDYLLIPGYGNNVINGGSGWGGYGYIDHYGPGVGGMYVQGSYFGGIVSDINATVNPSYAGSVYQAQPRRRAFNLHATGADPVDLANGTFQVDRTDLSLGQSEPRGITLGRYYNSNQRYYNPSGMGQGWVNNYYANAQAVPAPQASLGGTTPAQAAPMIVAACATFGIYNEAQPDPKNWEVTAIITKWAIDQLKRSGVSVQMGKDILQFVQQPNGTFTPPANCTWTLTQPTNYVLQERHGNTFNFDSMGRLTSVLDQYTNHSPLTVMYLNSTSSLPQKITDWKSRTLTFNYSGTPQRLASVSDSTSRSVSYGYTANTYDGNLDLTSVTDPEGKISTFVYNGDHEVIATRDALSQLVTTNFYDPHGFGQVYTQYTQGNTNRAWQIYCSGWQTMVQDPVGSKQRFFYDDKARLVGFQDALGNLSQTFFDGQDHLIMTISPLNETNQFIYDANNNLIQTVDALGFTNQFVYDNQNNLVQMVDARGGTRQFGYNTHFSLTGLTNGAGDWVNYAYNSDGTLFTRTDIGGQTTYGYDATYGQLNSITYPGSLGIENFVISPQGDVTSHTDARGAITTFQYNLRRQLTNTIAPTNMTVILGYDPVGNLQTVTDARGFSTINTWSPTRKLLATTLPAIAAGTPVITNVYDNRDWLSRTLDPLQQATILNNDIAGRLTSLTDPQSRTTSFGLDADGRRTVITNAAQEVTAQTWNARGELTKLTDNASHTVLRTLDGAGNEIILTNRNGKKWQFQFDGANRLTNTITPLGRQIKQVWNHQGLLQSAIDPSGQTTTLGYDPKGRLTNRTDNVGTTLFQYDANNNPTSIVENGRTNTWTMDAYNRVSSYKDADGNLIQYRFDANGNVTNLIYPGNRTVTYFYDSNNHLTNVTDWVSRKTAISYDLDGRIKTITRPNGTQRIINYDTMGEPTNIVEMLTNQMPIAFFALNWTNTGKVAWEFTGPLPHAVTLPTRSMIYDDDNRLFTFNGQNVTVDTNGNLTSGPLTNSTFATYTYNARNQLLSAGGLSYAYDPAGNRTAITNGANVAKFVVNPNAILPQVLMRIQNGATNYYVYGAGLLYQVTETATSTNTLTYHYDLRGSSVALTDGNGNVTDRIEYSAYGTTTYRSGTNDTPFLFNGRYGIMTDANGLLYMRARYYNPFICRFINPDPSGFSGGLNWYAYANGDPISLIDPFGLGAIEGWGGSTATWIGRNIVNPLNSVSTTSTTINFGAYMAASIVGGMGDLLRFGQGTAYAAYDSQNGWDVAIGVSQDIARAAGISTLVAGGLQGAVEDVGLPTTATDTTLAQTYNLGAGVSRSTILQLNRNLYDQFIESGGQLVLQRDLTVFNDAGNQVLGTFNTVENKITLYSGSNLGTISEELVHWSQIQRADLIGQPIPRTMVPTLEQNAAAVLQQWGYVPR